MGEMACEKLCAEVKEAVIYSILANETKDYSKTEQLFVVRYVDIKTATIHERFLTFTKVSSLNATALTEYILGTLHKYNLNVQSSVSQGYEGASVISGKCSGVQKKVMDVVPQAIYIQCFAHLLNLVLIDCAKNISHAGRFFSLLESLYVFIYSIKAHAVLIRKQTELYPQNLSVS